MSRISDLMLRVGDANAARASNGGRLWGQVVGDVASAPMTIARMREAANDRALDNKARAAQIAASDATTANANDAITDRRLSREDEAAGRALAVKTQRVSEWLTGVAGVSDPAQQQQAYAAGREALLADGTFADADAPAMFPGMGWVKSRLTMTLPAVERFKQLFPEPAEPPKLVDHDPTKDLIHPVTGAVVRAGTPAAQPPAQQEWVIRAGRVTPIAVGSRQPGDAPYTPPSNAAPDYEWILRDGKPLQVRKGSARPGDRPFNENAANADGKPSAYEVERSQRTIDAVDNLISKANGWTTGFGAWALSGLPATDARAYAAQLKTLAGNVAFNELAQMRAASKTGGALGAIAVQELEMLQSSLGALDSAQEGSEVVGELNKIRDSVNRWRTANGLPEVQKPGAASASAPPNGGRGSGGGPGPGAGPAIGDKRMFNGRLGEWDGKGWKPVGTQ